MGRGRKKVKDKVRLHLIEPTPEQFGSGNFERAGMAYRRTPVIDTLFNGNQLTATEYDALAYYRSQALQAEDDTAEESTLAPSKVMGGGGGVPGSRIPAKLVFTPAIAETGRIERDLGSLRQIAHAIAVEDMSLNDWCVAKYGGRERYDGRGRFVAIVPQCERENVEIARLELKMAARRISR